MSVADVLILNSPLQIECWTFLANCAYKDDNDTVLDIENAILEGAQNLSRGASWESEEEFVAVWYATYGDTVHSDYNFSTFTKEFLDAESACANAVGRAWALLFSTSSSAKTINNAIIRLHDNLPDLFFDSLMRVFSLRMYNELRPQGFCDFSAFHKPKLMCVVSSTALVLVSNAVKSVAGMSSRKQYLPFIERKVRLERPNLKHVPSAGDSIHKITSIPWPSTLSIAASESDGMQIWLRRRAAELYGSPTAQEIMMILATSGIGFGEGDIGGFGVAFLCFSRDEDNLYYVDRGIKLRSGLDRNIIAFALAHEVGHLIMHFHLLVAREISLALGGDLGKKFIALMKKHAETIEAEADWIAALLLVPPRLVSYLKTMPLPVTLPNQEVNAIYSTRSAIFPIPSLKDFPTPPSTSENEEVNRSLSVGRDNRITEDTFELRLFRVLNHLLTGEEITNWSAKFDIQDMFSEAKRDASGRIVRYGLDYDNSSHLVVRLMDAVLRRDELRPERTLSLDRSRFHLDKMARSIIHESVKLAKSDMHVR